MTEKVLIGEPCEGCAYFDTKRIGAGVSYCARFSVFHWPDARPFDCKDRMDAMSLRGKLFILERLLMKLILKYNIQLGELTGTVNDPRVKTVKPRKRKTK